MTERTHDLAGLTLLTLAFVVLPLTQVSLVNFFAVLIANQIGTSFPDLDQPTAEFYQELPAGSVLGHLFSPLLGGHRHISHSLLGLAIYSYIFHLLLNYLARYFALDMSLVWWSFVLGFASHLVMDSLTKEGVPWFFPIPIRFGFPPFKMLRITTGGFLEKFFVYPGLIVLNGYLLYLHYNMFTSFFSKYLVK